jgi:hypothetical protein
MTQAWRETMPGKATLRGPLQLRWFGLGGCRRIENDYPQPIIHRLIEPCLNLSLLGGRNKDDVTGSEP